MSTEETKQKMCPEHGHNSQYTWTQEYEDRFNVNINSPDLENGKYDESFSRDFFLKFHLLFINSSCTEIADSQGLKQRSHTSYFLPNQVSV